MSDAAEALRRVEPFAGLDAAAAEELAAAARRVRVSAGVALLTQGDAGDALYVVLHGRFVVEHAADGEPARRVGEVAAGEVVGEMAMLSAEPRATTVRAARASEVLELGRDAFERAALRHPALYRSLAALLAARLRARNAPVRPRERLRTVTLVPHDASVAVAAFAHALRAALAPYREALVVGADEALREAGSEAAPPGAPRAVRASGAIVALERRAMPGVTALERDGRLLLLVGDANDPVWTQVALAQADLVLVVAHASADPAPGPDEAGAPRELLAARELVLLHPPGTEPAGTARWLAPGRFARHHHLREGDPAHLARLARRLAGRSIALVLGGGGARGYAHIGVLRALAEAGVPIDRVGGTSMGSIIGGQVALGWDWPRILERTRHAFSRDPLRWDGTLPAVAKVSARLVVRMFRELFGEARAEDCWLPYVCIDASLTRAAARAKRDGPLWQRVRASSALPGIGPPVVEGGEFLVDGAVLNNLPGELLAAEGTGPVIAVNVSPREELGTRLPDHWQMGGWRVLWERLTGSADHRAYPSAVWVLQRTVLLGSVGAAERVKDVASLYLRPPTDPYPMFGWGAVDAVAQVGYEYAREPVRAWAAAEGITLPP